MRGSQQRVQPHRAQRAYGWARRLSGALIPLVPLAVAACRGDRSRAEATPQGAEATPQGAEATPRGAEATPRGADAAPRGADAAPRGADAAPRGADAAPAGAEATPRGADARSSPTRPASPAQTATAERRPAPAPSTLSVPAPWYLTLQPTTSGPGVRIANMDIRSFTAPLLEPGDIILAVDGRPVHSTEGLKGYLSACAPGDMVVLTVLRSKTTINYAMLQVPYGDAPSPPPADGAGRAGPSDGG